MKTLKSVNPEEIKKEIISILKNEGINKGIIEKFIDSGVIEENGEIILRISIIKTDDYVICGCFEIPESIKIKNMKYKKVFDEIEKSSLIENTNMKEVMTDMSIINAYIEEHINPTKIKLEHAMIMKVEGFLKNEKEEIVVKVFPCTQWGAKGSYTFEKDGKTFLALYYNWSCGRMYGIMDIEIFEKTKMCENLVKKVVIIKQT